MRFLVAAVALVSLTGCSLSRVSFQRSERREIEFENAAVKAIEVNTFNGAIEVLPHDEPFVDLQVTYRAFAVNQEEAEALCREMYCDIQANDGQLVITAIKPSGSWSSSTEFKLFVPANTDVRLQTSNGRISAQGIGGSAYGKTSNGSIEFVNVRGSTIGKTSNGKIVVRDSIGPIDLETSNGTVSFSGQPLGDGNRIRTSNGRVNVGLTEFSNVELYCRTSNGSIKNQLSPFVVTEEKKRELRGQFAPTSSSDAEPSQLNIRTSNGSITLQIATEPTDAPEPPQPPTPPQDAEISTEIGEI